VGSWFCGNAPKRKKVATGGRGRAKAGGDTSTPLSIATRRYEVDLRKKRAVSRDARMRQKRSNLEPGGMREYGLDIIFTVTEGQGSHTGNEKRYVAAPGSRKGRYEGRQDLLAPKGGPQRSLEPKKAETKFADPKESLVN